MIPNSTCQATRSIDGRRHFHAATSTRCPAGLRLSRPESAPSAALNGCRGRKRRQRRYCIVLFARHGGQSGGAASRPMLERPAAQRHAHAGDRRSHDKINHVMITQEDRRRINQDHQRQIRQPLQPIRAQIVKAEIQRAADVQAGKNALQAARPLDAVENQPVKKKLPVSDTS